MSRMVELGEPRPWAEAVFHVLAHVGATAHLPSSLFDPSYVDWVATVVGPAQERQLGEDAALLGSLLPTHESLAAVQVLAWLFDSAEQVRAAADRTLSELTPSQVAEPQLLEPLRSLGAPVEILRCAAELEIDALASLPPPSYDAAALHRELGRAERVAPQLVASRVAVIRSLRLRGRVRGSEIWVGVPGDAPGSSLSHVVWQACHEATVSEAAQTDRALAGPRPERAVERVAVVLLAERAAAAGRAVDHALWLAHFRDPTPNVDAASLDDDGRALLEACRRRSH